jgi:hypothetical protein
MHALIRELAGYFRPPAVRLADQSPPLPPPHPQLTGSEYIEDPHPPNSDGVGGRFLFYFRAAAPGAGDLVFTYK